MKKLLAVAMIMVMIPVAVLADYSSRFDMTMQEYLTKYNSISAPLGSPYQKLSDPYQWTQYKEYRVAWFKPMENSSIIILLLSKDPDAKNELSCGLDIVQICADGSKDFIDLISVTARSAEPVSYDLFGLSLGDLRVTQLIRYYYENGYKGSGGYSYISLDEEGKMVLALFETEGLYYFQIGVQEDI